MWAAPRSNKLRRIRHPPRSSRDVLVVLASSRDRIAPQIVANWGADRTRLLTCRDLSRNGWRYRPGAAGRSVAVIGGQRLRAAEIEGVLVRLPYVPVDELPHIVPGDRSYVAQEMTAFLTAWLSELPCPVVNRPTAECLSGPAWSPQQWLHVAAGVGMAVDNGKAARVPRVRVTVVGRRCFGSTLHGAADQVRQLAEVAGMELLDVHFANGPRFIRADPWPDASRPEVADALLECFSHRP
jgi:hypothetical protein